MFYRENTTHIWNDNNNQLTFLRKHIYPLKLRPFGRLLLPAPYLPEGYFRSIGVLDLNKLCIRTIWNHRNETIQKKLIYDCPYLYKDFPFVQRNCNQTFCEEQLQLNNKIIQKFSFRLN
jgi:hypothetical protein